MTLHSFDFTKYRLTNQSRFACDHQRPYNSLLTNSFFSGMGGDPMAQLVWRWSPASADRLPVVVRIPAGPLGSLKCFCGRSIETIDALAAAPV